MGHGAGAGNVWGFAGYLLVALAGCHASSGGACPEGGTGKVVVTFAGLPTGVAGEIRLVDPAAQQTVVRSGKSLAAAPSGTWYVRRLNSVGAADPRVRTVYAPGVLDSFCVRDGATQNLTVTWIPVPTSHKLWALNDPGSAPLLGFSSEALQAASPQAATVSASGGQGRDLAFDREGNAWSFGATNSDATLNRYPAAVFGTSGPKTPDIKLNVSGLGCAPPARGLAFDAAGNLWVSVPCKGVVDEFSPASLAASGTVTPARSLSIADSAGLAFDVNQNLFVAQPTDGRIWRYDAATLEAANENTRPAAELGAISAETLSATLRFSPSWIAFDTHGDLWANDPAAHLFYRTPANALTGSGVMDAPPATELTVDAAAVLGSFAFDEQGGIWTAFTAGKLARLGPEQLTTSTGTANPTVPAVFLASPDLGAAGNLALYPAPTGTGLYDAL